jgi:hypothetical protein
VSTRSSQGIFECRIVNIDENSSEARRDNRFGDSRHCIGNQDCDCCLADSGEARRTFEDRTSRCGAAETQHRWTTTDSQHRHYRSRHEFPRGGKLTQAIRRQHGHPNHAQAMNSNK